MLGIGRGRSGAGWGYRGGAQAPAANPFADMLSNFQKMFGMGESPMISRQFEKARESSRSRIAALGGGNIRAIKESEEDLAMGESAAQEEHLMSRQMMGAQLLKLLQSLGVGITGGVSPPGGAVYRGGRSPYAR